MAESIRKGMLVTISVLMADMTGKALEETPPEGIVYLHGNGDIFPKLEAALEGRFAGEGFSIHLEPEDAFGEYDAEAIKLIPAENFAHPEVLEPGAVVDEVPGEAPDGRTWRVTDIAEGMVVLEANHPLAGDGGRRHGISRAAFPQNCRPDRERRRRGRYALRGGRRAGAR